MARQGADDPQPGTAATVPGPSGDDPQNHDATDAHGVATPGADNHGAQRGSDSSRNAVARTEKYNLRGRLVSVDATAGTITVAVRKTNHGRRGRGYVGQTITFQLPAGVDLSGLQAGDRVEVFARLPRAGGVDLTQPVAALRVRSN
jgi:hypothetical protein